MPAHIRKTPNKEQTACVHVEKDEELAGRAQRLENVLRRNLLCV
jgi:hypothetical protein